MELFELKPSFRITFSLCIAVFSSELLYCSKRCIVSSQLSVFGFLFQSGVYIVARAYLLGYVIKYDQQNRVYVVVDKNQKGTGKFAGLCGNFNGNDGDDFKMLDNSQVTNPLPFAKSWQDQAAACAAPYVEDTCTANSERAPWAQKGKTAIVTIYFFIVYYNLMSYLSIFQLLPYYIYLQIISTYRL